MNEAQLIEKTLAGDSAAFGQLVTQYQDRLYHAVLRVLGSPEDAHDIVQDAFVQAYIKLETFQGKSAFYTWLYRIAFNLSISHRRRRKPTRSIEQTEEATGIEPVDEGEAPEARIERHDRAVQVERALASLSDEHRTVLVLREMEEASYETIGEILDLPVGTVRSRLHRARMQMRESLQHIMQKETD